MAQATDIAKLQRRIDGKVRSVLLTVQDLPALAADWDGLEEAEQASIALDWTHLMADYLTEIERRHEEGQLSEEQDARYAELKAALKEQTPIIEQLDLTRPPMPLD